MPDLGRPAQSPGMNTTSNTTKSLLTLDEALAELGVARSTFYRWLETGRGPKTLRLPNGKRRIRRADLDAWLADLADAA